MVHFIRALLACGTACVDPLSVYLAIIAAAPARRYHHRGGVCADSHLVVLACAHVGMAETRFENKLIPVFPIQP